MTNHEKVFDYIDKNSAELVTLLRQMVCFPTINDGESNGNELPMQEFFAQKMREEQFDSVVVKAYDDEKIRPNVVATRKGLGGGHSLAFNGHSDVVPISYPERWICPPFEPEIIDGKLYGRGTSDMKGGLAAAFFALKAVKDCGIRLKGDVVLHSSVGEESQSAETIGAERAAKELYHTDFAIVCEPSNLEVQIASSALVFFKLIVEGKGVHVSARNQMLFPQPGGLACGNDIAVDAFRKSLPLVDYFNRLEVEWNHRYHDKIMGVGGKGGHDQQGVGVFTMNPCFIQGGEYLGTVPSHMEYTYSIWYPDQLVSRDEILDEIRRGVASIASTDEWLREHPPVVEAPIIQDWPGFAVPEENPGVQTLCGSVGRALGRDAIISGFRAVCDAYYLGRLGMPAVVLGPGALNNNVHGDNEFIYINDLVNAAKIYAAMAMDWCEVAE
ncbi:MAG: ArgE/DapE family deacylase [Oscillospiraceae bacterium]|nr:ArgE/DapE family deacylase [Oscillospiraceae bacterium]